MRVSISNIAWDTSLDAAVAELLAAQGVDAIDIAPSKYFPQLEQASAQELTTLRKWWSDRHIELVGMQALFFGTTGLSVFGSPESQDAMLVRIEHLCRVASALGITMLVFGSPKNRDRSALADDQVQPRAKAFFGRAGDVAATYGVTLCLEPNPTIYGCNFLTSSPEAAAFVDDLGHPNIKMQLDTGTILVNGEIIEPLLQQHASLVGHIHISEPNLVPLSDHEGHARLAPPMLAVFPQRVATIEMLTKVPDPLPDIERAVHLVKQHYGAAPLSRTGG